MDIVARAVGTVFHLLHITILSSSHSSFTNEGIEAQIGKNAFCRTNGGEEIQAQLSLALNLSLFTTCILPYALLGQMGQDVTRASPQMTLPNALVTGITRPSR